MTIIVVDGPEKTGKTHTIKRIIDQLESNGLSTQYVHWGPVQSDTEYTEMLKFHTAKRDKVYVWDRGWPSEYVYGQLMYRGASHRMTNDPWIGAWCHDRAADANGLKIMLLPVDHIAVAKARNNTDLRTLSLGEIMLYKEYANTYGWGILEVGHDDYSQGLASLMVMEALQKRWHKVTDPLRICGPVDSPILFVGWEKSSKTIPGGWMPFTSRLTTMLGRDLGDLAIKSRWSNAVDLVPEDLAQVKLIFLCGVQAKSIFMSSLQKEVMPGTKVVTVPHPSYLYRFNNAKVRAEREEALNNIKQSIKELKHA